MEKYNHLILKICKYFGLQNKFLLKKYAKLFKKT